MHMSPSTGSRGARGLRLLLLVLAALGTSPSDTLAGGTSGSKATRFVRIRNLSSGPVPSGTVAPLLSLETREVGDAGNSAITINETPLGSVPNAFRIATFETTLAQYTTFLNAVAKRLDTPNGPIVESLYDPRMGTDANISGITRSGAGTAAEPYVYAVVGDPRKPVAYVSWFNAARFANWLHNGASESADTETGAYPLNLAISGTVLRNPDARWWIPTQNEWFKSAYYKGGGLDAGYWRFPTQSDMLPGNSSSDVANQANFLRLGVFSITQGATLDPAQNYLTSVGTFSASPGPYGTFDQGGNVDEWTDTVVVKSFGESRVTRGGAWSTGGLNHDVQRVPTALPSDRLAKLGFRLARTPLTPNAGNALTGNFVVTVTVPNSSLPVEEQRLEAGKTIQQQARASTVVVTVRDVANPLLQDSRVVLVNARIVCLTVSNAGGLVILSEPVVASTCSTVP